MMSIYHEEQLSRNWMLVSYPLPSLFDESRGFFTNTSLLPSHYIQGLRMFEDQRHVYVEAAVPGVDPKEVTVSFSKGVLRINALSKQAYSTQMLAKKAARLFTYRVTPENIDVSYQLKTSIKFGLIKVMFKKKEAKNQTLEIMR